MTDKKRRALNLAATPFAIMGMLIVEVEPIWAARTDEPPETATVPALDSGDGPDPREDDPDPPAVNLAGRASIDELDTWLEPKAP